jgi:serine protease AprX
MWGIFGNGNDFGANYPGEGEPPGGGEAVSVDLTEQKLILVTPNPVKEKIVFRLLRTMSSNSDIEIFDNTGKLIKRISISAGNREVVWDAKDDAVSSGVYFYSVKTENKTCSGKLIVQR